MIVLNKIKKLEETSSVIKRYIQFSGSSSCDKHNPDINHEMFSVIGIGTGQGWDGEHLSTCSSIQEILCPRPRPRG